MAYDTASSLAALTLLITITDVEVGEDCLIIGGTGGSNAEISQDEGDLVGGGCSRQKPAKEGGETIDTRLRSPPPPNHVPTP